jgi:hypothetical protein
MKKNVSPQIRRRPQMEAGSIAAKKKVDIERRTSKVADGRKSQQSKLEIFA